MESKDLKALVLQKLKERSAQVQEIKEKVETLASDLTADLKAVGAEVKSVEEIGSILIDEADEATSTGLMEPFDGPGARVLLRKLMMTPAGKKLEAWYQALRARILG